MILDAHVHLPVLDGLHTLEEKRDRLLLDLRRDGVDACVLIADSELESTIGSTEDCVRLFAGEDAVFVVGGVSPFIDYEAQLARLRDHLLHRRAVGIKLFPGHEGFYLSDPRLDPVYRMARELSVPVLFHSGWDNSFYASPSEIEAVLAAWPGVRLVCCHCLYPEIRRCLPLTRHPDLYFDLSSVADDPQVAEGLLEDLRSLIALAPGRVVFGSDYASCARRPHLELMDALALPEETRRRVLWENAVRLYGLPLE